VADNPILMVVLSASITISDAQDGFQREKVLARLKFTDMDLTSKGCWGIIKILKVDAILNKICQKSNPRMRYRSIVNEDW
jgi:hypothetical protein